MENDPGSGAETMRVSNPGTGTEVDLPSRTQAGALVYLRDTDRTISLGFNYNLCLSEIGNLHYPARFQLHNYLRQHLHPDHPQELALHTNYELAEPISSPSHHPFPLESHTYLAENIAFDEWTDYAAYCDPGVDQELASNHSNEVATISLASRETEPGSLNYSLCY